MILFNVANFFFSVTQLVKNSLLFSRRFKQQSIIFNLHSQRGNKLKLQNRMSNVRYKFSHLTFLLDYNNQIIKEFTIK